MAALLGTSQSLLGSLQTGTRPDLPIFPIVGLIGSYDALHGALGLGTGAREILETRSLLGYADAPFGALALGLAEPPADYGSVLGEYNTQAGALLAGEEVFTTAVSGTEHEVTSTLAASAAFTATYLRIHATASLNGSATFAISSLEQITASLSGVGAVLSALKLTARPTLSVSGAGTLSASAVTSEALSSSLTGSASQASSLKLGVSASSSIAGAGAFNVTAKLTARSIAALAAASYLSPNTYEPSVLGEGGVGEIWLGNGEETPPELTFTKLLTASLAADATLTSSGYAVNYRSNAMLVGEASLSAGANLFDEYPPMTFDGQAAMAGTIRANRAAVGSVGGSSAMVATMHWTQAIASQMPAQASFFATASFATPIEATLSASSTFQPANFEQLLVASVPATSSMSATELVRTHSLVAGLDSYAWLAALPEVMSRGTFPEPPPAVNAAVALEQFIDALGLSKKPTKTLPANQLTIVVNPRRRRQEER